MKTTLIRFSLFGLILTALVFPLAMQADMVDPAAGQIVGKADASPANPRSMVIPVPEPLGVILLGLMSSVVCGAAMIRRRG